MFLFIVAVSIHKYDLLASEGYFDQYASGEVLNQDLKDRAPIACKIWQIFLSPADAKEKPPKLTNSKMLGDKSSWIRLNPGYQYKSLGAGTTSADAFVANHFLHYSSIMYTYFSPRNAGLKTDLLQYLILRVEGGVYADLNT